MNKISKWHLEERKISCEILKEEQPLIQQVFHGTKAELENVGPTFSSSNLFLNQSWLSVTKNTNS